MKNYVAEIATDLLDDPTINPNWSENSRPLDWIEKIVVHHEAQFAPTSYDNDPRYRAEAEYQNNTSIPGSKGIQYHYHIDNVGLINQLRPLDIFLWHCGNYPVNQNSIAICVDGNFQAGQQTPTREQYESLKQLLDWLSTQHPEFPAVQSDVYPHRAFFATNCPGDNLVGWVDGYRTSNGTIAIPDVPYQHPELQPQLPEAVTPAPEPVAPQPQPQPETVTTPSTEATAPAVLIPSDPPQETPILSQNTPQTQQVAPPIFTITPVTKENNMSDQLKAGIKTSEFWVTVYTALAPILLQSLGLQLPSLAILGQVVAAVAYILGRVHLKSKTA